MSVPCTQMTAQTPAWQRLAEHWGFHAPVLAFALRTSLAAFAALCIAHALGLEHPHWAAMSAWASSQPMREHLLSRGMYRFGGSVVGVLFAVALVLVAQENLWVLAAGLALWCGACAFLGNLQRGYMVYGWMLAGYSAAMVVLLHHGPAQDIGLLAWDRMGTVVVGVLSALLISWGFAPRRKALAMVSSHRQSMAQVLQAALAYGRDSSAPPATELLSQLGKMDELLELYPEGSRTARSTAKAMRWQQQHAMELLYALRSSAQQSWQKQTVQPARWTAAVNKVSRLLQLAPGERERALQQALQQAQTAVAAAQRKGATHAMLTPLHALLQAMGRSLPVEQRDARVGTAQAPVSLGLPALLRHRDWIGARQAGLRAGGTLALVGALWAWTGAPTVAFGMLGLAVMLLVFSSFESPSRTMAFVLRGQIIGAGLALLCQALVWPLAQSGTQMVWMVLPFAIMGGLVFAHRRTAAGALDANMAMFILLSPRYPDALSLGEHASMALAVVAGPALAWVVYRWVYPTQAVVRMRHVLRQMWGQLPSAAQAARAGQADDAAHWRAQLHQQLLRVMRWANTTQSPQRAAVADWGWAVRSAREAMAQWQHAVQAQQVPVAARRRWQLLLQRWQAWDAQPDARGQQRLQRSWQALAQQPGLPQGLQAQTADVAAYAMPLLGDLLAQAMAPARAA